MMPGLKVFRIYHFLRGIIDKEMKTFALSNF